MPIVSQKGANNPNSAAGTTPGDTNSGSGSGLVTGDGFSSTDWSDLGAGSYGSDAGNGAVGGGGPTNTGGGNGNGNGSDGSGQRSSMPGIIGGVVSMSHPLTLFYTAHALTFS
jgi:hypothetical protein